MSDMDADTCNSAEQMTDKSKTEPSDSVNTTDHRHAEITELEGKVAADNSTELRTTEIALDDCTEKSSDNATPDSNGDNSEKNVSFFENTETPVNMILDGVERMSELLQEINDKSDSGVCSFWMEVPISSGFYTEFWENELLADVTLLVGPDQFPIRAHKLVLIAHFEYFKSVFLSGLKESTLTEVHLPFVGPEDLSLILKYAYSEQATLTKENVFKIIVMGSYFGCDDLLDRCCNFVRRFINLQNCVKLFEMVSDMGMNSVKKNCFLFILDHLPEVNKCDLSALPVELLLEIIQHPAAVIICDNDKGESEERLFQLIWNKTKFLGEEQRTKLILKVLKAVHLPKTNLHFLFSLLKDVGHIPEARDLIMKAGEKIDVSETREWYLWRYFDATRVKLFISGHPTDWSGLRCDKPLEVNGATINVYSVCVLIKGFPFFVYAVPASNNSEYQYHVESPVAIEHLGLPYEVVVFLNVGSGNLRANTYHNGILDRSPVHKSGELVRWIGIKVKLQSEKSCQTKNS